jgi:hypothetical protein
MHYRSMCKSKLKGYGNKKPGVGGDREDDGMSETFLSMYNAGKYSKSSSSN